MTVSLTLIWTQTHTKRRTKSEHAANKLWKNYQSTSVAIDLIAKNIFEYNTDWPRTNNELTTNELRSHYDPISQAAPIDLRTDFDQNEDLAQNELRIVP